jgi:sarcosine oxidase
MRARPLLRFYGERVTDRSVASTADVVIVGCGAAGLAAAAELAGRGHRVIGIEQFDFGHTNGSSHGAERIVRVAYADAVHAEMAVRSIVGWQQLERAVGATLLTPTGGLDIAQRAEIDLMAAQCERVGVGVERFSVADANHRFPVFGFGGAAGGDGHDPDEIEVMHHAASTVNADAALVALRSLAESRGATFASRRRVERIERIDDEGVVVHHAGGTVSATTCVVTVGAWGGDPLVRSALDGDRSLPDLSVTQEQVAYYRPLVAGSWPTFVDRSGPCVYGLPAPDGLVKIGEHHTGPEIEVDAKSDVLDQPTWQRLQRWVLDHLPGVDPTPVRTATCLYASYPGDTFLFDRVGPLVLGLGLSGHGFKFVPEVGRRLADLAERIDDPDNPFSFERPSIDVGACGQR